MPDKQRSGLGSHARELFAGDQTLDLSTGDDKYHRSPEANRVTRKGQPARYVATPGYCREISPAKITCTPTYSGGHWVAGTPGTAGGPRKYSYVEVIDCQDLTHAAYRQGRLRGNWSKYVGDEAQFARNRCPDRANFKVKTMKL